jgi:ApaG protein
VEALGVADRVIVPLPSNQADGAVGSVSYELVIELTGNASTAAVGSVGVAERTFGLTGNQAQGYVGTLIAVYWKIIDEKGTKQEIEGEGVVGEKPIIEPNSFFQYTSGTHLSYPSGIMTGHYGIKKDDGAIFNVKIPAFSLDVPSLKRTTN